MIFGCKSSSKLYTMFPSSKKVNSLTTTTHIDTCVITLGTKGLIFISCFVSLLEMAIFRRILLHCFAAKTAVCGKQNCLFHTIVQDVL
mmetsp:Transcript_45621/g.67275  ORF Transcript_45621/g.67275 Transcript_45621/m.67275 type:complete len:88 (+) Transcript_45621:621-884(+)